ncbi:hypothetical protein BHE97_09550 [Aeromicrobium sp. PE09-221]|uniref:hypothetical protein n=1 Tax=Aeromicrobium sp. PE09-221 TaxID=1898043 RepID=UPI000B3EA18E|nr:hypothetical protein [Aeromicrobium sp. PE09-221]OUZ09701.1 hypothetical protein BHE97_09550 [Aeromicrobium sp. PE09-221]
MTEIALGVALAVLAALAVLQLLAASGLPVGRVMWSGAHRVLPRRLRLASATSVLVYAVIAVVLLSRGRALPGGDSTAVVVLTWAAAAFFALSVPLNAFSRSPAERWAMTPTSALLAASAVALALGS